MITLTKNRKAGFYLVAWPSNPSSKTTFELNTPDVFLLLFSRSIVSAARFAAVVRFDDEHWRVSITNQDRKAHSNEASTRNSYSKPSLESLTRKPLLEYTPYPKSTQRRPIPDRRYILALSGSSATTRIRTSRPNSYNHESIRPSTPCLCHPPLHYPCCFLAVARQNRQFPWFIRKAPR